MRIGLIVRLDLGPHTPLSLPYLYAYMYRILSIMISLRRRQAGVCEWRCAVREAAGLGLRGDADSALYGGNLACAGILGRG